MEENRAQELAEKLESSVALPAAPRALSPPVPSRSGLGLGASAGGYHEAEVIKAPSNIPAA